MKRFVVFVEEPSAAELLKVILPKLLPADMEFKCIHFQGKQDLEGNIERKLRGWLAPDTRFLVMRDRDSENCIVVKRRLVALCAKAGKPQTLVRIACGELESFYLGDMFALSVAFNKRFQVGRKAKFRNPDQLGSAAEELKRLTNGEYQKISGTRAIAPLLKLDGSNSSRSFNVLLDGIRRLVRES